VSAPATSPPRAAPLRRDPANGILGGVCAGLGRRLDLDPIILRVGFVVAATAGGAGALAYALAWAMLPTEDRGTPRAPSFRRAPGAGRVAIGVGLLVLSALLLSRQLGLWLGDAAVWPLALAATGAALIWRQSQRGSSADAIRPTPRPERAAPAAGAGSDPVAAEPLAPDARGRVLLGSALVVGGGLVFLWLANALQPARDVVLAVVVVIVAAGLILAPWWVRLVRGLGAERAARIRSQERAELAAHLHDSVLQTLALVQKRAADPRAVAGLARRQERELRAWLTDRPPPGAGDTVAAALERAAADVEEVHGTPVEVVTVGDCPLDDHTEAVASAAREALVNAAKFAPDAPVSLYAEMSDGRVQVFVKDRGPGFDPATVPADRRGLRESIIGRMERHGGRATVHSTPGEGTEVELILERRTS
jgi:signal transduction histidine kinase/phage shock protein PspC (stress-responsive transcriptional regulator)